VNPHPLGSIGRSGISAITDRLISNASRELPPSRSHPGTWFSTLRRAAIASGTSTNPRLNELTHPSAQITPRAAKPCLPSLVAGISLRDPLRCSAFAGDALRLRQRLVPSRAVCQEENAVSRGCPADAVDHLHLPQDPWGKPVENSGLSGASTAPQARTCSRAVVVQYSCSCSVSRPEWRHQRKRCSTPRCHSQPSTRPWR
jgi:hypothetical protein